MSAVDEFMESSTRDEFLTVLLAPAGEEIRTRTVRTKAGAMLTPYWVIHERGYDPAHGGQTVRTRWLLMRHGVTDEPLRAATESDLHSLIAPLFSTSDIAVPQFPEKVW